MTKVRITPVVSYKVEVELETDDGDEWLEIGNYDKESEWEQFIKLTWGMKVLIIQKPPPDILDMLDNMFGKNENVNKYITTVVSATKDVFPKTGEEKVTA